MTLSWHCPTQLLIGEHALAEWLAGRTERAVLVVVDTAVADRVPALRRTTGATLLMLDAPDGLPAVREVAGAMRRSDLVIGIGGGTVLDVVKLAAALSDADVAARLTVRQRGGLVLLPRRIRRDAPLVLVPTTVGTGVELSPAACLAGDDGKRLVLGNGLRPDVAVLDPEMTATLPGHLVLEGVAEALFRVIGPFVGDPVERLAEDALALAVAEQLVRLGDAARVAHGEPTAKIRLEIAKLSGLSQTGQLHLGRDPFCAKAWFLGNELSWSLGLRKMTAISALLPPIWRATAEGDGRLGSARRLARMWTRVRSAARTALPEDPAAGIAALFDDWGVTRDIGASAEQLDAVARRTVRNWGAGLPMMAGFGADDVRALLEQAVCVEGVTA